MAGVESGPMRIFSSRAATAVVALALAASACSSGGGDEVSLDRGGESPVTTAAAADDPNAGTVGDASDTDPVPPADDPAQTTAPATTPAPDGAAGGAGQTTAAPPPSEQPPASTSAPAPPPPSDPAASPAAAPGTYTYDSEGEIRAGANSQPTDGVTNRVVEPANGTDQRSKDFREGGSEASGETTVRRTAEGTFLVHLITREQGTREFRPDPPVLVVPRNPVVDQRWEWTMTSTDGDTTVSQTARVRELTEITVDGQKTQAVVVESTQTIEDASGLELTIDAVTWYSLDRSVEVRQESDFSGQFGAFPIEGESTRQLRSLTPT